MSNEFIGVCVCAHEYDKDTEVEHVLPRLSDGVNR